MFRIGLAALAAVLAVFPAAAAQIHSGAPFSFTLSPRSDVELVPVAQFTVEPGTRRVVLELATDDPSHDLDLFVRTGRPAEADSGGDVVADHASTTNGSGVERIEIAGDPVQSGVYFVAVQVLTLNTQITGALRLTAEAGLQASTFLISRFALLNDDGWRVNFPASGVPGESVSDFAATLSVFPPGFLRMTSGGTANQHFAVAPKKFLGNLAVFRDAQFEFDFRHVESLIAPQAPIDLRVLGAGAVFRWLGPVPPPGEWIHVMAPLDAEDWTRISGEASFEEALSNVERIELSMDHAFGGETAGLDNFAFSGEPRALPVVPNPGPASTNFETSLEGWSRNYPPVAIPGARSGSPRARLMRDSPGARSSEGFLKLEDGDGLGSDCIVAPARFIGDLSGLDRPWIEFDFRRIEGPVAMEPARARLISASGAVFVGAFGRPREEWRRTRIPFLERYWIADPETPAQPFAEALTEVRRLEICLDLSPGAEATGIDNFHLRTEFTPATGRALQATPESLMFTAAEGGPPAPAQQVEVTATGGEAAWEAPVEPASAAWLEVSPDSGMTPAAVEVRADPAGLSAGVQSAVLRFVAAEPGVADRAVEVTFVVESSAGLPVLSPGGRGACGVARPAALGGRARHGVRAEPGFRSRSRAGGRRNAPGDLPRNRSARARPGRRSDRGAAVALCGAPAGELSGSP